MRTYKDFRFVNGYFVVGCSLVVALAVGLVLGVTFTSRSAEAQAARTFSGGTALMLNYVKADATTEFEAVMRKVSEALGDSENAERRQQGQGWKVYKAREPGQGGSVLYVWIIDPTVSGADYAVSGILNEAFPGEVQQLYEQFNGSFAGGQAMVNLDLVPGF